MKKIFALLLTVLLLPACLTPTFASDGPDEDTQANTSAAGEGMPDIQAKSGLLMDDATGTVLFEKNAHEKMPPASITKIMTLLLVMEAVEKNALAMNDMVTCSSNAESMGGTQIWLKEGEQMSVGDLLKATAVASANDAAMALAEQVGGSEEGFVAAMNSRAAELGMADTVFHNPTGLDAEGHVSSAYDIALMSRELMSHPEIRKFTSTWMDSLRDGKTELVNTNKLVRFYKGCTGLKTGTTSGAGSCVSVTAERDGMGLISVIMGATTSNDRFAGARKLLDFGFGSFVLVKTGETLELPRIKVTGGVEAEVEVETDAGGILVVKKGQEKNVTEQVSLPEEVGAPVLAGQKLGEVRVLVDGQERSVYPIMAKNAVEKMTLGRAFQRLFSRLCSTQL